MKTFDDSNWREEYKSYTRNKMELDLLEHGPKSLSQSWHLQALYSNWKKVKGITDPERTSLRRKESTLVTMDLLILGKLFEEILTN